MIPRTISPAKRPNSLSLATPRIADKPSAPDSPSTTTSGSVSLRRTRPTSASSPTKPKPRPQSVYASPEKGPHPDSFRFGFRRESLGAAGPGAGDLAKAAGSSPFQARRFSLTPNVRKSGSSSRRNICESALELSSVGVVEEQTLKRWVRPFSRFALNAICGTYKETNRAFRSFVVMRGEVPTIRTVSYDI